MAYYAPPGGSNHGQQTYVPSQPNYASAPAPAPSYNQATPPVYNGSAPPVNYAPPANNYAPPPANNYAPPPVNNYAPPPANNYAPPPANNYYPPPTSYAPAPSYPPTNTTYIAPPPTTVYTSPPPPTTVYVPAPAPTQVVYTTTSHHSDPGSGAHCLNCRHYYALPCGAQSWRCPNCRQHNSYSTYLTRRSNFYRKHGHYNYNHHHHRHGNDCTIM